MLPLPSPAEVALANLLPVLLALPAALLARGWPSAYARYRELVIIAVYLPLNATIIDLSE